MENIELAKEKLLTLINKHKDNAELHGELKDVFEAVSFNSEIEHTCPQGFKWNGIECVPNP